MGTLLALWLAFPLPEIAGDSACPTPMEVQARLADLADERHSERASTHHRVYLTSTEQSVHIELLDGEGALLAERRLDRTGTCGDIALAAAVVLAAWEAKLDPGVTRMAAPLASPSADAEPAVTGLRLAPPTPPSLRFDAGLGLLGALAGNAPAYGATLVARLFPTRTWLGVGAALSVTSTRRQTIAEPPSSVEWMRGALALGPTYRFGGTGSGLDLHASAVLALLHTRGSGLPKTDSDTSVQLGLAAGLRGLWVWQNAAGWLGVDVSVYPGDDRLTVENHDGDVGRLPKLEVALAFGVSLGQFR